MLLLLSESWNQKGAHFYPCHHCYHWCWHQAWSMWLMCSLVLFLLDSLYASLHPLALIFLVQAFLISPCSFFRNTWKYGPPPYSVTLYKQKGRHYHLWSEKMQLINFIFSFEYSWTIYCYLYVHVHVHVHVCDYCCYWNSSVLVIIWFNVFFVFCLTNVFNECGWNLWVQDVI